MIFLFGFISLNLDPSEFDARSLKRKDESLRIDPLPGHSTWSEEELQKNSRLHKGLLQLETDEGIYFIKPNS